LFGQGSAFNSGDRERARNRSLLRLEYAEEEVNRSDLTRRGGGNGSTLEGTPSPMFRSG